ncbi:DUF4249 domain-containing protein [Pedobacter psychrodurus]|uniref:DUF4249 domain-containing protein n=1 Tax=Pedobacter psychrodurus TaxID=2530456 RepID=UPI00292DBF26|nr:DUF4249 domain-containing protein [Pedobacter psychrodurus]
MIKKIRFTIFSVLLCALSGCEKVVELDLRNDIGQLVIEGNINNLSERQTVRLSTNVSFSGGQSTDPVSGAEVTVSEGTQSDHIFRETTAGTYIADGFRGTPGRSYTLRVINGGTTYTAVSVMPAVVELDSVSSRIDDFDIQGNDRQVSVHYRDPVDGSNQYRFVFYIDGVMVRRPFVNNDMLSNGRNVRFDLRLLSEDPEVRPGANVRVEMQCVDLPVYTYWFSLRQQGLNGAGGGVTPSNPPNNISPTALGYFSAHTAQIKSTTVR